jgi:alkanesulfonate monooxygenase SsuD/methylene tetrahydromethanopterin reductase-like flavin-dependent oxidoreductase (luciferase family)
MADILTGGRVIFGVGRGYHTREVETFGSPLLDQNANREMFEEGVEVLFKGIRGQAVLAPGPVLHAPAGGAVSRLYAEGNYAGAGAAAAAGRMLAADPERLRARLRLHGEIRHQRRDRRRLGRRPRRRAAYPGAPTCQTSPVWSSTTTDRPVRGHLEAEIGRRRPGKRATLSVVVGAG